MTLLDGDDLGMVHAPRPPALRPARRRVAGMRPHWAPDPHVQRLLDERRLLAERDRLQAELAAQPWPVRWLNPTVRQELAAVEADLATLGDVQTSRVAVAHQAIDRAWRSDRDTVAPDTNPYRPDAAHGLSERAHQVADVAHRTIPRNARIPYGELPGVAKLLTPDQVTSYVQARIAALDAIASSDEMLPPVPGSAYMYSGQVVTHARSGLSAVFAPDRTRPGLGVIYSKQGASERWEHYVGLGIGAKIYRYGASLYPELRWASSHSSAMASGLRRKLHAEDPWLWEYSGCTWCSTYLLCWWEDASPEDLINHDATDPLTPRRNP